MAATKSIIVLAPNGRRQTVKVTPNHTILQILEEVCKKQGYKSEEYDLRHHNHIIDTQTILRFSGLPNNAMLEMSEAVKIREESDVVLGVQLEDGTRLLGTYSPSVNLTTVLGDLCPQQSHPDLHPVVIYMRREVFGEDLLKNTTLRALGLTGGRAMLRLIHRKPEELKYQANVSAPLPVKPVEEKEFIKSAPKFTKSTNASDVVTKTIVTALKTEKEVKTHSNVPSILKITPNDSDNANVISKRDFEEPQSSSSRQNTSQVKQPKLEETPTPMVTDDTEEDEIKFLGERNAVAYSLSNCNISTAMYNDLPDEFFDLTVNDVKKLLKDLKRQRAELEDAPLQTRELRKLEESKKVLSQLGQYKRCVLRIQFPDRIILQGTFLPSENIQNVLDFVSQYLQYPNTNYHLFITPPKRILQPDETLVELGCVPSALLHFGIQGISTVEVNNTPSHMRAPFLNNNVMQSLSTPTAAILAATKSRGLLTRPTTEDNEEDINSQPRSSGCPRSRSPSRPSGALTVPPPLTQQKMPKWFRPSK